MRGEVAVSSVMMSCRCMRAFCGDVMQVHACFQIAVNFDTKLSRYDADCGKNTACLFVHDYNPGMYMITTKVE